MDTNSAFITNSKTDKLIKRIVELINNSKELKFLVGFFYFSGIRELYNSLKDRKDIEIKVLVGLSVDKYIHGLTEFEDTTQNLSDNEKTDRFLESVSKSANSDEFDTEDFYVQVRFFINLIKENKLIIRKTYNPNHAKLYIFKLADNIKDVKDTIFITGSSNLTKCGLSTQNEFNVEISDYGTKEAEDFFDNLWNSAVKITENTEYKQKLIDLIENKTLIVDISPFEAFAFILKTYIDTQSQKSIKQSTIDLLLEKKYKKYKYQFDAVSQALSIIETYNGVIISDVVGLGKSVIASMVVKNLSKRGVIICRPGLMGNENKKKDGWHKYKADFKLHDWEIRSSGNLKDILNLVQEDEDLEVVIVDEAHNFRNQDTEDYALLSDICRNKIVILLTATPFNNSPDDIFSLLKLFIIPGKSQITLDDNIDSRFKYYGNTFKKLSFIERYYNSTDNKKRKVAEIHNESLFGSKKVDISKVKERTKYLSDKIRAVIEPVLIRRNRIDLEKDPEYKKEVYDLSKVKDPPCELFFQLTEEQSKFYDKVINEYFGEDGEFKGAIYRPFEYEIGFKEDVEEIESEEKDVSKREKNRELLSQKNLYDFMRRLLVKRFESSFNAFQQSLINFYSITEKVQEFITKTNKYILDRKLLENIYKDNVEEIEEELVKFKEKLEKSDNPNPKTDKIYEIETFIDKERFLNEIESDKKLFEKILKELKKLNLVENDPKSDSLIKELKTILNEKPKSNEPKRKVVIFTEYIDTAIHIEKKLEKEFRNQIITVKGDLSSTKVEDILENFDASYEEQKDNYDILVATDKISEGFNLNRAGAVINYDIPWNPTRVIQRVGRLNRISKKVFAEIYLYNFFPTIQGADIVKSRQIAGDKMFIIHNTLGEDVKIFDSAETPTASQLYKKIMQNPETTEEESFQTKIRQKYFEIKEKYPEIMNKVLTLPPRIKTAKQYSQNNLIVFIRKGLGFFVRGILNETKKTEDISFENAYDYIECGIAETKMPLSEDFWQNYIEIKNYKEPVHSSTSEQNIERKAINNLKSMLETPELKAFNSIIRTVLEDGLGEFCNSSNAFGVCFSSIPTVGL